MPWYCNDGDYAATLWFAACGGIWYNIAREISAYAALILETV
jgi:hypothetical protein